MTFGGIGPRIGRRIRALFHRAEMERELDDELRFHIDMEVAERVKRGMSEAEARASALRDFGGIEYTKEVARDARGVRPIEDLLRDTRFALRTLARRPAFTAVLVATIGIAVGATSTIFGAVYGVLLAPFPYDDPDRIVILWHQQRASGERDGLSPLTFHAWKERSRSFDKLALSEPFSFDYLTPAGAETFSTQRVTEDFFPTLAARPLVGRALIPADFESGAAASVVLSEGVWTRRFQRDSSVVGSTLILDSIPRIVRGVMPTAVDVPYGPDLWAPRTFTEDAKRSLTTKYTGIGRLHDGVTVASARQELDRILAEIAIESPRSHAQITTGIATLPDQLLGSARGLLLLLLGAVGFVLLIACANVASVLLARAVQRRRELAIRVALGASRTRIARQLVTESLVIAIGGCLVGLLLTIWGIDLVRGLSPEELSRARELRLSWPILLCAVTTSVVAAVLAGAVPAAYVARSDMRGELTVGGASVTADRPRRRLQRSLVAGEVALALVLLVGAGLLMRSFAALTSTERGYETDRRLLLTVQAWNYFPTDEQRASFVRDALARLAALPGVVTAGSTSSLPLAQPIAANDGSVRIEGDERPEDAPQPVVRMTAIAGDYLGALRIPLKRGRAFGPGDDASSHAVALINETMARRYFARRDPIGQRLTFAFMDRPITREIVGIVGDTRHEGLHQEPQPGIYVAHAQVPSGATTFVLHTAIEPGAILASARRAIQAPNPAMPLTDVSTMDELLARSLRPRTFGLILLAAFAGIALLLAAIGVYGVMSQVTAERTHEMGVRSALGATGGNLAGLVLQQSLVTASLGVVAGLAGAAALTRLLEGLLYGVRPLDPVTFLFAAAGLIALAALATLAPARRAASVDPITVLRHD